MIIAARSFEEEEKEADERRKGGLLNGRSRRFSTAVGESCCCRRKIPCLLSPQEIRSVACLLAAAPAAAFFVCRQRGKNQLFMLEKKHKFFAWFFPGKFHRYPAA